MSKVLRGFPDWRERAINVVLVGAGGNGSEIFDDLMKLDSGIKAFGHKFGLNVAVFDDALVTYPNTFRQRFWPCDVGNNKAICLVQKANAMLGLCWVGMPRRFVASDLAKSFESLCGVECDGFDEGIDILITAVDLPSVRVEIGDCKDLSKAIVWLDVGNNEKSGQAVIGLLKGKKKSNNQYPNVIDHYPQIRKMNDNSLKSCSAAESLSRQDILINKKVSLAGMSLIWDLLRYDSCKTNVVVVDIENKIENSISF